MPDEQKNSESTAAPAVGADTSAATDTKQPSDETQKTDEKADAKFTQKDIDDAIQKRLDREKKKQDELETQVKELASFREQVETEKKKRDEELAAKELEKAKEKGELEKVIKLKEEEYARIVKEREEKLASIAAERDTLRSELEKTKIDNALMSAAGSRAINPSQVVRLLKDEIQIALDPKTNAVMVDGDTNVSLESVVASFLDKNPHLAKSAFDGKAGGGSEQPRTQTGPLVFTRSQIADPTFFKEHRTEILKAQAEGRIK